MHRLLVPLAGGLLAVALVVTPASATTTSTTTPRHQATTTQHATTRRSTTHRHRTEWRDIAGVFRTQRGADARLRALEAKQVSGFRVLAIRESHARRAYEVEETFLTHRAAQREATLVRRDGFKVRIVAV